MQSLSAQVVQPSPDAIERIQGPDQHLLSGVRPFRWRRRERLDQIRHEHASRIRLVLQPRRCRWRPNRGARTCSTSERRSRLESVRRYRRRADRDEQSVLLRALRGLQAATSRTCSSRHGADGARSASGVFPFAVVDPADGTDFRQQHDTAGRWIALGVKLATSFPAPNLPGRVVAGGRTVENYGVSQPQTEDTHKFDIRSDYYLSPARSAASCATASCSRTSSGRRSSSHPSTTAAEGRGQQYSRNQSIGASWTRTFGRNMVNELRFGYNRTYATFAHATASAARPARTSGSRAFRRSSTTSVACRESASATTETMGTGPWRPQYPGAETLSDHGRGDDGARVARDFDRASSCATRTMSTSTCDAAIPSTSSRVASPTMPLPTCCSGGPRRSV